MCAHYFKALNIILKILKSATKLIVITQFNNNLMLPSLWDVAPLYAFF